MSNKDDIPNTISLQYQSNGVDTVYIRRASIEVTGQY